MAISQVALDEMEKNAPTIFNTAELIKELYDADLRVELDVSKHVYEYGSLQNDSSIMGVDWQIPNISITLIDADEDNDGVVGGYYNHLNSASWWRASTNRNPNQCYLRLRTYIRLPDGTSEMIFEYIGKIDEAVPVSLENEESVEIITTLAQSEGMNKDVTKDDGDSIMLPHGVWT